VPHKNNDVCRHRTTWIVGGGSGEWCYVCGAYRGLQSVGVNARAPRTRWIRPTGDEDKNPTEQLNYKVRKLRE
jgi:hypothetical protein